MRLFLVALAMALALAGTALAAPATQDLRAPDQQAAPTGQPAPAQDLRAPDQQVAPIEQPAAAQDLRAPDQQVAPAPTAAVPAPVSDGGPDVIVFVLIGVGAALLLFAAGYVGMRHRHRLSVADADLLVE